jgi:hypothetical protein
MDNAADLRVLFGSAYPLVFAATRDEGRFMALLRAEANKAGLPVWMWTAAHGLARDGFDPQYGTRNLVTALAFVADLSDPGVFVFADAHPALEDPVVVRAVKDAAGAVDPGQTILLTGPDPAIPAELEGLAVAWELRPPGQEELRALLDRTIADLEARRVPVRLDTDGVDALAASLKGLDLGAAERMIQQAVLHDGALGPDDVAFVNAGKFAALGVDGALELIESERRTIDAVGGMNGLKEWLRVRGAAFRSHRASDLGIEPPRGVLLTGVPGCGKSLIAKTLAATWGIPLLLLDPGRIYRKYVGESEQRLDRALDVADAMAPTVLWIDEIEKGFAAGDGDGGVSTRVLGTFLRWLQDRPAGVFVVATANDVSALPPELLRKGRFDEIFFVDLPGDAARAEILRGQLTHRGHAPEGFDIDKLVAITQGFSGAEIEALVVGALYRAFAAGGDLVTEELIAEAEATVPLSRSRSEDVAALRAWAEGRTVKA